MKQHLPTFARDVDALCAKLNDGLSAVAILLGFLAMTMCIIRAQEIMPDAPMPIAGFYQVALGE